MALSANLSMKHSAQFFINAQCRPRNQAFQTTSIATILLEVLRLDCELLHRPPCSLFLLSAGFSRLAAVSAFVILCLVDLGGR
jgi:hypothetical protein